MIRTILYLDIICLHSLIRAKCTQSIGARDDVHLFSACAPSHLSNSTSAAHISSIVLAVCLNSVRLWVNAHIALDRDARDLLGATLHNPRPDLPSSTEYVPAHTHRTDPDNAAVQRKSSARPYQLDTSACRDFSANEMPRAPRSCKLNVDGNLPQHDRHGGRQDLWLDVCLWDRCILLA